MRLLRIRAVMDPLDMANRELRTHRPRLIGKNACVEVIGPAGEVLGLLACTAFHIECTGRNEPIRAHVTVDVAEVDLLALEAERVPEDERQP